MNITEATNRIKILLEPPIGMEVLLTTVWSENYLMLYNLVNLLYLLDTIVLWFSSLQVKLCSISEFADLKLCIYTVY